METKIVTYWVTQAMADAKRHGLRGMLEHAMLMPASFSKGEKRGELDALVDRLKKHPAFYSYCTKDKPIAVNELREQQTTIAFSPPSGIDHAMR